MKTLIQTPSTDVILEWAWWPFIKPEFIRQRHWLPVSNWLTKIANWVSSTFNCEILT